MQDITNVLTRTQLRALGEFLLGNEQAVRIGFEAGCTEDTLLALRRDDLETARANGEDFENELTELEEANRRVGFYMGLKAGARLMMELLGEGEIKF